MMVDAPTRARWDLRHVRKARELAGIAVGSGGRMAGKDKTKEFTTQMSKACSVALSCPSPVLFKHWIAYQAGRAVDPWSKDEFRDPVYSYIDEVCEGATGSARGQFEGEVDRLAMQEIARFLGFVRRSIIARQHEQR